MSKYDVIIIGAGPAGLTACLYCLRARLNVLLVDKLPIGGTLAYIKKIENFPGFPDGINGMDLADKITRQLKQHDFKFFQKQIKKIINLENGDWQIESENDVFQSRAVIVATGSSPRKLGVVGEDKLIGKGVSYCAICDAPFFQDKEVVVIGGGNTALEEALYLTKFASQVTLVHRRDAFRADKILQEKVLANGKIICIMSSVCIEINGYQKVESVLLKSTDLDMQKVACAGVFIFVGMIPETEFLLDSVKLDASGCVISGNDLSSSAPGIFACGDCRNVPLRQVITACGEGAVAAFSAGKYIEK